MGDYIDQTIQPLPWIGLYAAAASLICTLSMAADAVHAVRCKKFWFPCKFFTLNAMTLTLLGVGTKLTVDLNTPMEGTRDQLSKLSSTIFMTSVMGNSLTSLGAMDDQEMLMSLMALVILVVTAIVNICIEIRLNVADYSLWTEYILATTVMFIMLLIFVSSALSVPIVKEHIKAQYQEMDQTALNDENAQNGTFSAENVKSVIRRYWVMAATGNPQFVMARSATSTTCGAICLLSALTLGEAIIRISNLYGLHSSSDYHWSTMCILVVQSVGIAVGTIAPTFRWFTAAILKCLEKRRKGNKFELKIETYWTQQLEYWQESRIPFSIRGIKGRKLVYNIRYIILSLCIKVQIMIVGAGKFIQLLSASLLSFFKLLLSRIKILRVESEFDSSASTDQRHQDPKYGEEQNLSPYILLLEGEIELPRQTLKIVFCEVDELILKGKKQQPKYLLELLGKSQGFHGVADFDNEQVPSLCSKDPPNCWTLPVVTLASIAIALPNIQNDKADRLLRSVSEGLRFANMIVKHQNNRKEFINICNAADLVWVGLELYHKWLEEDINSLEGKTSPEVLEGLAKVAERNLIEFKASKHGKLPDNPLQWPLKVIAANSLYRISKTMLLYYQGGNDLTDEQLFAKISIMIADIFLACLASLPHIISMKCHSDAVEKRERSIRQAAILLAGNNLVKNEFGAYGEKIFGSSSSFLQSNYVSRHLSNPQYYLEVNDDYVKNKIKMILFPFLHKGHWIRATEMVGGEILYKPPYCDINAPDLYIPMMAFGTCMVLAGFFLGINGNPEALGVHFTTALLCWIL
ncbi:uncharacterized protein [Coffea arabica]|uniref:Uncharacterized protein isoform X2 n=1 Tax=Coffea arabica TaxID=13443 RepID=A0ABM4VDF7_COFAR